MMTNLLKYRQTQKLRKRFTVEMKDGIELTVNKTIHLPAFLVLKHQCVKTDFMSQKMLSMF